MRIHTNQLPIRILGSVMAIGFLAMGVYALGYVPIDASPLIRERASGFGTVTIIAGIWALLVSWLDSDLTNVWCKPPKPLARKKHFR